jgi:hypothetical protein
MDTNNMTETNGTPLACLRCAQHLPILIHQPQQLAHKLPGADRSGPPEEHPH